MGRTATHKRLANYKARRGTEQIHAGNREDVLDVLGDCFRDDHLFDLRRELEQYRDHLDVLVAGRLAVREGVLERIEMLGCCGKA